MPRRSVRNRKATADGLSAVFVRICSATFPAADPCHQLGHVLTDDRTLRAEACATPRLPISDHRALVVDVSRA